MFQSLAIAAILALRFQRELYRPRFAALHCFRQRRLGFVHALATLLQDQFTDLRIAVFIVYDRVDAATEFRGGEVNQSIATA
jgi:hypothetical protein